VRFSAQEDIEKTISDALERHACPGVSLAVQRSASMLYSRGFGLSNIETQTPASASSIFRIGSLTKQFTAAAIIKLASVGQIEVKSPAATYLPVMRSLEPFTILELLNHTAGLHSDERDGSTASPLVQKTQVQLAEEIAYQTKPFDFDPGTAWLYSNANYVVLGAIIEAVTQKALAESLRELVFAPLNLRSAALDSTADIVVGRASGYTPTGLRNTPYNHAAYIEVSQAGGAGAMRANVTDLCRWHQALLSKRLFDQTHVDLMLTPGRLRDGRLSSANRFSTDDTHYGDTEYACGVLVSGPSDPNPNILHYGAINGFAAVLQTYLAKRLTFAALCNGDFGPAIPFRGIRQALVSRYLVP
jgi:CubicO group peptidase (beta-lactamase class C family)